MIINLLHNDGMIGQLARFRRPAEQFVTGCGPFVPADLCAFSGSRPEIIWDMVN
jgi:hypothetical protein